MFVYLLEFFLHFFRGFFSSAVELLIRSSIETSPTLSQKMSNPTYGVALEKVQNKLRTSLDTYTHLYIYN